MRRRIIPARVLWTTMLSAAICFHAQALDLTNATTLRGNPKGGRYQYRVPEKTDDGWETGNLSSAKLNASLINEFFGRLNDGFYTNLL